jgi:hypothetical protein
MSTITEGQKLAKKKKSINNEHINAKIKILILLKLLAISIFFFSKFIYLFVIFYK